MKANSSFELRTPPACSAFSRSYAYEMANQWIDTNGELGIPAIRLGRRLLVTRAALENWASGAGAPNDRQTG